MAVIGKPFAASGAQTLAVATPGTSATAIIPVGSGETLSVYNSTNQDIFVETGGGAAVVPVVAALGSVPVPKGTIRNIDISGIAVGATFSVIAAAISTGSAYFTRGNGGQ